MARGFIVKANRPITISNTDNHIFMDILQNLYNNKIVENIGIFQLDT